MESTKIRMKIGDHEFEAEGSPDMVQAQFQAFTSLIQSMAVQSLPVAKHTEGVQTEENRGPNGGDPTHVPLEKILHVSGRVVSLTAIPSATESAALLIMLGQKNLRNNESVTGQEIGDGLAQSGRPVVRVDRVMEKAMSEAYVLKSGFKRATRYRLTNSGNQKALAIARELIATLP